MNRLSVLMSLCCAFLWIPASEALLSGEPMERDTVKTAKGNLEILPIEHATFVMKWNKKVIYVDPVGEKERFQGIGDPDLVLITHDHFDHLNPATLNAVCRKSTDVVVPKLVAEKLKESEGDLGGIKILANGETTEFQGIKIEAVPMYNFKKSYHPKGQGNGYLVDLGGTRVYIAGDTEDIPEMRALKNIDVAFICMNLPFTMTAEKAASAVLEFQPKIVYPYHFRGQGPGGTQGPEKFQALVGEKSKKIEVRLRKWYKKG